MKIINPNISSEQAEQKPSKMMQFLPTLSFLSCLAYGKHGITAVTLEDDAILQALIMMSSSIKLSFISPQPLWIIYTSSPLTLSPISTLKEQIIISTLKLLQMH